METQPIKLRRDMTVTGVYSVHYIEMSKAEAFTGERHDYWEVLYVDRNDLRVTLDEETFDATAGDLIMIAPGQFHAFACDKPHTANVMLVAFECKSPRMAILKGMRCSRFSDTIMRYVLQHCKLIFERILSDPYEHTMVRRQDVWPGEDTFLSIALTEMLNTVWRHKDAPPRKTASVIGGKAMAQEITEYMRAHLDTKLTIKHIEDEFHISKSYIQRIFARYQHKGAMHYFTELKMERARELLRARDMNVTKIAEALGYDNIYHFCNQFKKYVRMSPLEYRNSIRNFSD